MIDRFDNLTERESMPISIKMLLAAVVDTQKHLTGRDLDDTHHALDLSCGWLPAIEALDLPGSE